MPTALAPRCAWLALAFVGLLWGLCQLRVADALATAGPPDDVALAVAVDANTVIGQSATGCSAGARLSFSHDRGGTWTPEPVSQCAQITIAGPVPGGVLLKDQASGLVVVHADASRSALPALPPEASGFGIAKAGGGRAYDLDLFSDGASPSYVLDRSGAGWTRCGDLPTAGAQGFSVNPAGDVILVLAYARSGSFQSAFMSSDACASWRPFASPAGCVSPLTLQGGVGGVTLACTDAANGLSEFRSSDGGLSWGLSPLTSHWAQTSGGLLRPIDNYSDPGLPDTWQTLSPPVARGSAPAAQQAAIDWVNARFRRPLGLPDLVFDERLALAGQRHTDYWATNGSGSGLAVHSEQPGRRGFSGVDPSNRCAAAGVPDGCGEVAIAGGRVTLINAAHVWLGTPYHGGPFFNASSVGFGASAGGVDGELGGNLGFWDTMVLDPAAPANAPSSLLRVWPADGMSTVPTTWSSGETPDPLAKYSGNHDDVGPAMFVVGLRPPYSARLTGPSGAELPLLIPGARTASTSTTLASYLSGTSGLAMSWPFLVAKRLAGGTTYRLSVTDADGRRALSRFRTEGSAPVRRRRVRISARFWLASAHGRLKVRVRAIVSAPGRSPRVALDVRVGRAIRHLATLRVPASGRVDARVTLWRGAGVAGLAFRLRGLPRTRASGAKTRFISPAWAAPTR